MKIIRNAIAFAVILIVGAWTLEAQQPGAAAGPQEQQMRGQGQGAGQGEGRRGPSDPMSSPTFMGMALRSIGPAVTEGRVLWFAVDPGNRKNYYVATASGGVWKTTNQGVSYTPIFDGEGSYSIGTAAADPKNFSTVWVGTGENNSQRSASYGDGVYRSDDGGRTWRNLGLKNSEHIARILIDPRNSDVVYVAAQGPLWAAGGDRGLYKTIDGGKTWKAVLTISEHTGVTDVVFQPDNPDVLYAAAYQRERHYYTLIDGGPESAIYKSTDAGATWTKLRGGLPTVDMGRIGLAVTPADPRIVYAQIEAADHRGGIYRSTDYGATWERRNPYDNGAMYYGTIFADPKNPDRIFTMGTIIMTSDDGGENIRPLNTRMKHVDNHIIYIDPQDTDYYLVGCDGGIYTSFDRGATWEFHANLPVTQFYDVTVDTNAPFYSVYGGAQDNGNIAGPSRTRRQNGIVNHDWFETQGGDGFHAMADPEDPNTIYAELQGGNLVRDDRRTGERVGIVPQEGAGEPPMRWDWDAPFIISPYSHTRLYFGSNRLFRSDDRGDSWRAISPDLTRHLDRNLLPVMGKIWGPDAVAKNQSTAFYGNITTITESPKKEGLLYIGTDDGLIQVTEDGGGHWRKVDGVAGVPKDAYVAHILASNLDSNTAYAAYENHQNGDFKPYLLRTTDAGKTWTSIAGDLPASGPVWSIAEDPGDAKLLFVGTEYGLYFSVDGGQKWIRLRGGLPTIAVRDLAIQRQMNDLALATFGRGFYILDDYAPLRSVSAETLAKPAALFAVRDALLFVNESVIGSQGANYYAAPNPPNGATFTYYLKESAQTKKQRREQAEREADRAGKPITYPSDADLRAEAEEESPTVIFTVTDADGNVVRRVEGPATAGIHRVTWDMRYPASTLPAPNPFAAFGGDEGFGGPTGPLVMPGQYRVSMAERIADVTTEMAGPVAFNVVAEGAEKMSPADRAALTEFQRKVARLQGAVTGALEVANSTRTKLGDFEHALVATPAPNAALLEQTRAVRKRVDAILLELRGDTVMRQHEENEPPSISSRVGTIVGEERMSTQHPTKTQTDGYQIAASQFGPVLARLRELVETDFAKLEKALEAAGAPHTPGRLPDWKQ